MKRYFYALSAALLFSSLCFAASPTNSHHSIERTRTSTFHKEHHSQLPTPNSPNGHDTLDVVILGDSNTYNGGDDCTDERGWNTWFKRIFGPRSCKSYARSGATWTNTRATVADTKEKIDIIGNNNVIYNQINRLKQAHRSGGQPTPHLILICAGTNDAWFTKYRPAAYDMTASQAFADSRQFITRRNVSTVLTLAESVRYGCEMLIEAFPNAQIVLITPPQCTKVDAGKMLKTGDIIEQCGNYMSIGVVRLDKVGAIYGVRELQHTHATAAGVIIPPGPNAPIR